MGCWRRRPEHDTVPATREGARPTALRVLPGHPARCPICASAVQETGWWYASAERPQGRKGGTSFSASDPENRAVVCGADGGACRGRTELLVQFGPRLRGGCGSSVP